MDAVIFVLVLVGVGVLGYFAYKNGWGPFEKDDDTKSVGTGDGKD